MRFVIVTGMSGAGKSTVLKMLEDMGFFCVDNLPVMLIEKFAEIAHDDKLEVDNVAIGVDIRSGQALGEMSVCLETLKKRNFTYEILFLDANEPVLVKRYKETRRAHPLSKHGRINEGIVKEREKIEFLRQRADYIIDTSNLLTRELKHEIEKIFVEGKQYNNIIVTVMSFGFKYGIPRDSDLVFDVRFLPNPYYVPELRPQTGNDKPVSDMVKDCKEYPAFMEKLTDMLEFLIPNYLKEGKNVLFTGTPCQVDGLYRYLRRNYDNLLTLDLVCHGVPSNTLFHSYLLKLEDLKKVKISMFEFRRRNGWGFASAISDRGKLEPIYDIENLYMYAFDKAVLFRKSCYACPYARLPRVGDCSIADFWGIGRHGKSFKHNVLKGVSLVLANNAKGINAVQNLQESFVEERTLDEALAENYNIIHPSPLHPMRDKIIAAFLDSSRSLKSINKEFELIDNSLKERVKEYASRYHIYDLLKNIYNKYKAL